MLQETYNGNGMRYMVKMQVHVELDFDKIFKSANN